MTNKQCKKAKKCDNRKCVFLKTIIRFSAFFSILFQYNFTQSQETKSNQFHTICPDAKYVSARVTDVSSNTDIILDTGRQLKLADLMVHRNKQTGAVNKGLISFMRTKLVTETITFFATGKPDRHQRLPAHIFLNKDEERGTWLQEELIATHQAQFMPDRSASKRISKSCDMDRVKTHLLKIDGNAARHAAKNRTLIPPVYAATDNVLWRLEGDFAIVEGVVLDTRDTAKGGQINFGEDWRKDFTAVITSEVKTAIERHQKSLSNLIGRRVQLRGFLDLHFGPSMRIDHPSQMELLTQ